MNAAAMKPVSSNKWRNPIVLGKGQTAKRIAAAKTNTDPDFLVVAMVIKWLSTAQ